MDLSEVTETCSRLLTAKILAASGSYEWFRLTLICYTDGGGEKESLFIAATNVNQELNAIKALEFIAESDPLTRIPNKDSFLEKTRALLRQNTDQAYAIVRLDVEHFSTINQLFGTNEGNVLLKFIAVKIQEYMEADGRGLYCRLESDVFCVVLPYEPESIAGFEDYIEDVLRLYPMKFELRCSFGCYRITDAETPVETMIDRAFAAQKTIKGNVIHHGAYYNEALQKKEETAQRIALEMRGALADGQFRVFLQPKCDMRTGEIVGSEELVRWIHPQFGMISPGDFIPVFEQNGFISELDRYILKRCCQTIRGWLDDGVPALPISVNISRTDLYDPKLFEALLATIDAYDIPHDLVEFELTESAFVKDSEAIMLLNSNLRSHGFRVLMDDFGSGYSSLNCLRELVVDVLKIDLKFLPASKDDRRAWAILEAVVSMAGKLGLDIVVEGVETAEQTELLQKLDCRVAQGFFFHRPMSISDYEKLLIK